jgi:Tfp pilus assembly protein FimT
MRPTRISGVTMIELMAVIAVLIVLVLIAAPSFADFFDRNRVRAAGDDLVSIISDARAEAVKNDLDVNIALTVRVRRGASGATPRPRRGRQSRGRRGGLRLHADRAVPGVRAPARRAIA